MGTRAGRWAQHVPESIHLPTVDAPQYVNEDGYEVDAETFIRALDQTVVADPTLGTEGQEADGEDELEAIAEVDEGAREIDDEDDHSGAIDEEAEDVEEEEVMGDEAGDAEVEPLLSLADSNVLHYSLMATRQHHLKHLLPHVFSHPPIPTNSRPRARPPPRGTFLWPTPPPLVHPLPHREYHAPSQNAVAGPSGSPAPEASGANGITIPAGPDQPKKRKYQRKPKDKTERMEAPAHEIECIARVTLSIGPISYPGTELWVGRFVMPRAEAPKAPRVKRDKADKPEKAERKRANAGEGKLPGPKRLKGQGGPPGPKPAQYRPPPPGVAGTSNYGPPRPPSAHPHPGQGPPRPPAPTRAELSPDLIRRVNEAATRHPWLSQIIHKAARTQATKEELAKLGRVVNRLKEGKDVGEGADDPILAASSAGSAGSNPATRPPQPLPAVRPSVAPGPASNVPSAPVRPGVDSSAASETSEPLTPPPQEDDSDSDSDVDMTGPRQVGGGPGGEDPAGPELASQTVPDPDADKKVVEDVPMRNDQPIAHSALPSIPASIANEPPHASTAMSPNITKPALVTMPGASTTRPQTESMAADSSSISAPSYARPPMPYPGAQQPYIPRPPVPIGVGAPGGGTPYPPGNHLNASQSPQPPPPPPPQRPTYPLPPPFLVVAFKEAPTEKYLLPLGSLSYISRQGEQSDLIPVKEATPPRAAPATDNVPLHPPQQGHPPPVTSRTRASLGRSAKEPTPPPVPETADEPEPIAAKPKPPKSGLPPLAGTTPADGVVLISTFVPTEEWRKPDWKALSASLPFNNPRFDAKPVKPVEVKNEPVPESPDPKSSPTLPRSAKRSRPTPVVDESPAGENMPFRAKLLNLAAESFMPEEGGVHAVTIRLSDVTDQVWQRIKTISGMIATAEMKALGEHQPDLMPSAVMGTNPNGTPAPSTGPIEALTQQSMPPPPPSRVPFLPSAELKEAYLARKRNLFRHLLARVSPRRFLRFRLSSPRPDIVDATTDKWGPRPYPISTKALYTRDEEYADDGVPLSPEPTVTKKGSKKAPEPEVTFEMPVSLDQLDEMVAENAMKGGKAKGIDGRKRHGKRYIPGTICEGCGEANKRVWRAGPGGKGTLCNACGDKWTSGALHTLAAPGAASKAKENDAETTADAIGEQASSTPSASAAPVDSNVNVDRAPESAGDKDITVSGSAVTNEPIRGEEQVSARASATSPPQPGIVTASSDGAKPAIADHDAMTLHVDPPRDVQIDGKRVDAPTPEEVPPANHIDSATATTELVEPADNDGNDGPQPTP